jgi:hypothetical protein
VLKRVCACLAFHSFLNYVTKQLVISQFYFCSLTVKDTAVRQVVANIMSNTTLVIKILALYKFSSDLQHDLFSRTSFEHISGYSGQRIILNWRCS